MKKNLRSLLSGLLSLAICLSVMSLIPATVATAAITDSEAALSLTAAKEGMVLLKNEGGSLPLAPGERTVALFGGAGAMRTGTAGTGAESNRPGYTVSVYDGLKKAGFTITSENWLQAYDAQYQAGFSQWEYTPWDHFNLAEPAIDAASLSAAAQGTDTAIYVVRRLTGEGSDRKVEKGSFLLDDNEMANLTAIANTFDKVILLLNTCGPIDMAFTQTIANIDAILYISLPGMEGGNAVASILTGQTNPSGKLSATWAKTYNDYPSAETFADANRQFLSEDIYVGYRWFETFDPAGEKVAYPFGHGLSYTTFDYSDTAYSCDGKTISLQVKVQNTGSVAGKEVVQIYHGAPMGKLGKAAVSLIAYQKTDLLAAGASQTLQFSFAVADMASYDDEGDTGHPSCYVLEAGDYPIYVGTSSSNARNTTAGTYVQEQLKVTQQLTRYVSPVQSFEKTVNTESGLATKTVKAQASTANAVPTDAGKTEMVNTTGSPISYSQLLANPSLMDDYIGQFSTETLAEYVRLLNGHGAGIAGRAKLQENTPELVVVDGVSGLNYDYTKTASYPCPTCLAQTFNDDLVRQVASAVADQIIAFDFDGVLAPGINIQQSPLCGRNFGYFSEDPLLSGNMGAAYVIGAQSKGVGATPKHFAANTKETNRSGVDSIASERALREIYLKSFQITVEKSDPWSVMTSYNKINGVETDERSDLINGILRGEWGYDGVVMTDWGNNSNEAAEKQAGCDLNTFGTSASPQFVVDAVANGHMSKTSLQMAAKNILKWTMKAYQNIEKGVYAGIQTIYADKASKIQAEAFNRTTGSDIGFEDCGDVGGTKNPTNTNSGKVFYYALKVELAGTYRFTPRAAAPISDGYLTLSMGSDTLGQTPAFQATGGWQVYSDQPYVDITLPQGESELAVTCNGTSYNLNYFTLEPLELDKTVMVIHSPADVEVPYNTSAQDLSLPQTVLVTLNDDSEVSMSVSWDLSSFLSYRDGTQTVTGTITPPDGVVNQKNLKATLTLQVADNPNPVTKITITNPPESLYQGASHTFTAQVEGEGSFCEDLVWSVDSTTSSISPQGVLTVSEKERAKTLTVTASSLVDPEIHHTLSITVLRNTPIISVTETTLLFGTDHDASSVTFGTETCMDSTGGTNITDFNNNRWIEFNCLVEGTGTYSVSFRYASPGDKIGSIQFFCDGTLLAESNPLASTGGWQTWSDTESHQIELTAGAHTLRLQAIGNSFNMNYVAITPVNAVIAPKHSVSGVVNGVANPKDLKVTLQSGSNLYETQTDATGAFSFDKVSEGTYTLTVSGESIYTAYQTVTIPINQTLTVTVKAKGSHWISATQETRLFGVDYDDGAMVYDTEECLDETGGHNLKDLNGTRWIEFHCKVEGTGTYRVSFRYASPVDKTSRVQLYGNGNLLAESDLLASTGGWQTWAFTETHDITLSAGEQVLRLQANGNNFNINYLQITPVEVSVPAATYTVSGTVSGANTLEGLSVVLENDDNRYQTSTYADGTFALADVAMGEYTLSITGETIEDYTQALAVTQDTSLTVIVTEKTVTPPEEPVTTYTVSGAVSGANTLEGLSVVLENGDNRYQTSTDADGAFALAEVAMGEYTLNITGETIEDYTQALAVTQDTSLTVIVTEKTVTPPEEPVLYGDVDGNGSVDAADALKALQHAVKLVTLEGETHTAADVNGDESVDATDALLMLQYTVKLIDRFPVEALDR